MKQLIRKTVLLLSVLCIFSAKIPIDLAEIDQTNVTNVSAITLTPNNSSPDIAKFQVKPTVLFRLINNNINGSADGLAELYMDNPFLNDVVLNVDARISIPPGIHIYGEGFGEIDSVGTVYGTFHITPGRTQTIKITIKAEKKGEYFVQFSGLYWPETNKASYNPISNQYQFNVYEPSSNPTLSITKSAFPYSLRQFQESTIKVLIENFGTSEVKDIEIMDSIHPSFDLTGGDFPNPKKFDSIRAGESRELQYTIKSKESGAFTLDPATVTYADSEGNIQEVKSEPVSIKVVPSSDGDSSGTNTGNNSKSASVSLHGEKTDVVVGEDILLRFSAVNPITKPKMQVQVIIIPPSGMSVQSSEFTKSASGQFTAIYQLEPGYGKDIAVSIQSNQIGDFNVNSRIIYFWDDKAQVEDHTLTFPIKVRKETMNIVSNTSRTPGFAGEMAIIGILFVVLYIKRRH